MVNESTKTFGMWSPFEPGSSTVDWCEANYDFTPNIAEFVNTFSNILFFIIPPVLIHLFKPYAIQFNKGVQIIWVLLGFVGVFSAYFHATLSLIGQLLDEISILWVVMAGFALWFPGKLLPKAFQVNRAHFQLLMCFLTVVSSLMACIQPAVNAFALMLFGIPAFCLLVQELKKCQSSRVYNLGVRSVFVWILAVTCWISDRLFCDLWASVKFPYLHGAWHILIFIASYTACVLFAYFDALHRAPDEIPVIKFWPIDTCELGVPYVVFKHYHENQLAKLL